MNKNYEETVGEVVSIDKSNIKVKLIELPTQPVIPAMVRGKMRRSHIRISVGDKVKLKIDINNPDIGVITFRNNPNRPMNRSGGGGYKR